MDCHWHCGFGGETGFIVGARPVVLGVSARRPAILSSLETYDTDRSKVDARPVYVQKKRYPPPFDNYSNFFDLQNAPFIVVVVAGDYITYIRIYIYIASTVAVANP